MPGNVPASVWITCGILYSAPRPENARLRVFAKQGDVRTGARLRGGIPGNGRYLAKIVMDAPAVLRIVGFRRSVKRKPADTCRNERKLGGDRSEERRVGKEWGGTCR